MTLSEQLITKLGKDRDESATRVRKLLKHSDARSHSETATVISAHEARHLWRRRSKLSKLYDGGLEGAEPLLAAMDKMHPNVLLEQYGFSESDTTAILFFARTSGEFVGAVFVESHSQQAYAVAS